MVCRMATRACLWCGDVEARAYLRYPQAGVEYYRCSSCGVLFAGDEHYRHDYRDYDYTRSEASGGRSRQIARRLESGFSREVQAAHLLQRLTEAIRDQVLESTRHLDVGCGPADFLAAVQSRFPTWELSGVDPSHVNVREAWTRHGIRVRQGYWEDQDEGGYGLITMFGNVMLHKSPRQSLVLAHQRLDPGGLLVFDVKNPTSATRALLSAMRPLVPDHRVARWVYRQAFHGMPWGLPQQLVEDALRDTGFELLSVRQRSGRNAALSARPSLGMRMSAMLDRLLQREPWIEFIARKPGGSAGDAVYSDVA